MELVGNAQQLARINYLVFRMLCATHIDGRRESLIFMGDGERSFTGGGGDLSMRARLLNAI